MRRLEQLSGLNTISQRPCGVSYVISRVVLRRPGFFCVIRASGSTGRCFTIAKSDEPRINDEIRCASCRLIGVDGSQLGIFAIRDAQRVADEQGLDLVEIAPNAEPPVCRVMNYGKYKYEQELKAKAARKNQVKVDVKEMKFRPKMDTGDYETKKRHVVRFLESGAKVKITIMFRGREMAHPEIGLNMLEKLAEDLSDVCTVEVPPKLEGRNMHMMLAPLRNKSAAKEAEEAAE